MKRKKSMGRLQGNEIPPMRNVDKKCLSEERGKYLKVTLCLKK